MRVSGFRVLGLGGLGFWFAGLKAWGCVGGGIGLRGLGFTVFQVKGFGDQGFGVWSVERYWT